MAGVRSGLAVSEWAVVGAAGIFLLSLTAFDWFAFSVEGRSAPGTEGDAFRWLDGFDYVLVAAGSVAVAAPLVRLAGLIRSTPHRVAVVTGAAGLIAAIIVTYLIASPPDVNSDLIGAVGGGPSTETTAGGGAVIGLASAVAVAALSGLTLLASPAALEPAARRPPHPATPPPHRPPKPKPAPREKATAKPKPPTRKRAGTTARAA